MIEQLFRKSRRAAVETKFKIPKKYCQRASKSFIIVLRFISKEKFEMKKHIIGFTIFTFIVGSFAIVWALFGYFTQTIPNVPKVEPDNLPVFKSERKTSCRMNRQKFSYEVLDSHYFADDNMVVSTVKLKWNGYGTPPESVTIQPKLFTADNSTVISGSGTFLRDVFRGGNEVRVTVRTTPADFSKEFRNENFYTDLNVNFYPEAKVESDTILKPQQVIVVHGDSSIPVGK